MRWYTKIVVVIMVGSLMLGGASWLGAEELTFPETKDEIIKALSVQPPNVGRGGLRPAKNDRSLFGKGGRTRGLAGIAEDQDVDESLIEEAPKVGALILFDYDSAAIQQASKPLLEKYGKALQEELSDIVVVIAGHTDNKGSDQYNLALAKRRARSVKQFLVKEFQIETSRLLLKSYGEEIPIASNDTAEGRAKNRRVEFIRVQ